LKIRRNKILAVSAAALIAFVAAALSAFWLSLPRRSGVAHVPGLTKTVQVALDAHAVPRLHGASIEDVFRAQGFVHAQERFFQMDLTRRSASGELAALVGARALPADRSQRPYAFRRRAAALVARLPAEHRAWLAAYSQGVNAGLDDLGAWPPEYLLLRRRPEPWTVEDSLLVNLAIYTMLSNNEGYEKPQAVMRATLPIELYEFLTPSSAKFDRPVLFPADDRTGGYVPIPVPPPAVVDLRNVDEPRRPRRVVNPPLLGPASNQWASDASRSSRGDAILANDPHLQLRVPGIFYRTELYWPEHAVRGVGIPGLPGILIGASEQLAWGATVSNADQSDWIVVEVDERDPEWYLGTNGFAPFGTESFDIRVAGEDAPMRFDVRTTEWGPVVDRDGLGRPLVLHATWLTDDGINLDILELMRADSVESGLAIVGRWDGPSLNWMLADSAGRIGWGINGPVPHRIGFDGSAPETRSDGRRRWNGLAALPKVATAADGVLFTANSRTVPSDLALSLGRMWMRPTRAQRIEELLRAKAKFSESDYFAMQLDTAALTYQQIRDLVLEVVPADETDESLAWARRAAMEWNGRADADSAGARLMYVYYRALLERALAPLFQPALATDAAFVYRWPLADEPLARLLEERPAHLVPRPFAGWREFLRTVLGDAIASLDGTAGFDRESPWGQVNRLDVAHPLAAVPVIGRWLRLPSHDQPGSLVSLRVAAPAYGAVIRMGVSPAKPEAGFLQMAGGQSGHFLSRNFADLHADWAKDVPTPFLAGPTDAQFTLVGEAAR
jgi:penicillin amidase